MAMPKTDNDTDVVVEPAIQVIDNPLTTRTPAEQRDMPHIYFRNMCGGDAVYLIVALRDSINVCPMCLIRGLDNQLSLVSNKGALMGVKYAEQGKTCEAEI